MTPKEVEAIVGGYHGDPFRILGPHAVNSRSSSSEWEIRAFLPQAQSVEVLYNGAVEPMKNLESQGVFRARIVCDPRPYRLRLKLWNGDCVEQEDPYCFPPLLTDFELHLHGEGTHYEAYNTFGAHLMEYEGVEGVRFAVWAPNAETVSVIGEFNEWDTRRHPMRQRDGGVWEIFIPEIGEGVAYKYHIRSRYRGYQQNKSDPYGFASEEPPKSASVIGNLNKYQWSDEEWMTSRTQREWLKEPHICL